MPELEFSTAELYKFVFEVQFGQLDVREALIGLVFATTLICAWWLVRYRSSPVTAWLTGCSVSLILAMTLVPQLGFSEYRNPWRRRNLVAALGHPDRSDLTQWLHGYDGALNVLLFIPAGMFLAAWMKKPLVALVVLITLSVLIEVVQAASATREGRWSDVIANSVGALVGIMIQNLIVLVVRRLHMFATDSRSRSGANT